MIYDLIIVGAGPAGITAAIYAARKKLSFLMIYKELGGEVAKTTYIENYPGFKNVSGEELTHIFEEHMRMFKFDRVEDIVTSIDRSEAGFIVNTSSQQFESRTVILTTGAVPKSLGIPGEIDYRSKGISYCATCDAPLFEGKDVAVIGAGNTGLTSTIQLMGIARNVYLINKNAVPKADPIMVEKALSNPKVKLFNNSLTTSIVGKQFVESITFMHDGKETTLPVDGVFINIGYLPNAACVKHLLKINEFGEIIVDSRNMTSTPGLFAAGDATNVPYKQIVIAAAAGANALLGAYDYLAKLKH